jgi:hypothetical protein
VSVWPNTATAITALRNLIYDGPTHKLASLKKVLWVVDGNNQNFKTFEFRRITNFTTATYPLGVFKDGAQILAANILSDDTASGTFQIASASIPSPAARDIITATYYYQWFIDSELDEFLQQSSVWLGFNTTYINIPDGLTPAALRFAAQQSYEAVAMKYSIRMSQGYQLEDAPSEDILKSIDAFQKMASSFMEKAETMRNDFYTRQGQSLAPNFGFQLGNIVDPVPRR